ncbi:peptidase A4 family [Fusarium beomiforme]|uniref:Peptidase A4 family n=1 Tax=Fusarium beomiforme TaxID=44412 RepID=A0A9P5ABZ0_9HYPO|nr:peptidase A4 family [Fusarium beomiforme]
MKLFTLLALAGVASAAPILPVKQNTTSLKYDLVIPPIDRPISVDSISDGSDKTLEPRGQHHKISFSENWAGATMRGSGINFVQGSLIVPDAEVLKGSGFVVFVAIDGRKCKKPILQTGIFFMPDGVRKPFYQWSPKHAQWYRDFEFSPGDEILMTVDMDLALGPIAQLDNLTTNKTATHQFDIKESPGRLCMNDASWIVEAYQENHKQVKLMDFIEISINNATYSDVNGPQNLDEAELLDIRTYDGDEYFGEHPAVKPLRVITESTVEGDSVTIRYTGNNRWGKYDTGDHTRIASALERREHDDDVEDDMKKLETHHNWRADESKDTKHDDISSPSIDKRADPMAKSKSYGIQPGLKDGGPIPMNTPRCHIDLDTASCAASQEKWEQSFECAKERLQKEPAEQRDGYEQEEWRQEQYEQPDYDPWLQ